MCAWCFYTPRDYLIGYSVIYFDWIVKSESKLSIGWNIRQFIGQTYYQFQSISVTKLNCYMYWGIYSLDWLLCHNTNVWTFNDMFTNDVVSFEQLGPEVDEHSSLKLLSARQKSLSTIARCFCMIIRNLSLWVISQNLCSHKQWFFIIIFRYSMVHHLKVIVS